MSLLRRAARACLDAAMRRAAWCYVCGPRLADGLAACEGLARLGTPCTLGFWNRPGEDPDVVLRHNLAAIEAAAARGLDCVLAVKVSPLGFDRGRFESIAAHASRRGLRVVCDAMRWEAAESTLALAGWGARHYPGLGVALPARWRRSGEDAERAIDAGLAVRIVKGECGDPGGDADPTSAFVALAERLAGRASQVGVATHDPSLAREALGRLLGRGTACEHELLFGLPMRECADASRDAGVRLRVYVPYGNGCVPYSLADAKSDRRIAARALRDVLLGKGRLQLA